MNGIDLYISESCLLRPVKINSVLEELRVWSYVTSHDLDVF